MYDPAHLYIVNQARFSKIHDELTTVRFADDVLDRPTGCRVATGAMRLTVIRENMRIIEERILEEEAYTGHNVPNLNFKGQDDASHDNN